MKYVHGFSVEFFQDVLTNHCCLNCHCMGKTHLHYLQNIYFPPQNKERHVSLINTRMRK